MERFGAQIPLHNASRKWAANHRDKRALTYPSPYVMRFYTLTQELHWLQCTFDTLRREPKEYSTVVIVHPVRCDRCGEMFVCEKRRPVHGLLCPARKQQ